MTTGKRKKPSAYLTKNKVKLIRGGEEYFELMLQLINEATTSIHLQVYIISDDQTGQQVADALRAAAKRNVLVYLLADGYASQSLPQKFINELEAAGINFRFFEPFFKSKNYYFGRRLHHKVFVADAKFGLVGGVNIANRYNDMPGEKAWLDVALFMEGEIVIELCVLCWKTWKNFPTKMSITPCEEYKINNEFNFNEKTLLRIRRNDWVRHKNEISATYIEMFRTARSQITILCSYFLPGKLIRRLLLSAANRGVKIKVITAGQSDIMISKYAERWMYDWLLRNKIELFEYQPTILHAKIAVCDGEWLTIGSYNINNISAYASIELNIDVRNANFANDTDRLLENIIKTECIQITKGKHLSNKSVLKQFVRWSSYQFIRGVFFLLTFYFKRRE
ncbi:MAG: phospholipase D-like domain-containing protein [Chitinophagaceae bacterium]